METKTRAADSVLYDLVTSCAALGQDLSACFERMDMPVVVTRMSVEPGSQEILFCNNSARDLTGYDRDELRGQTMRKLYGDVSDAEVLRRAGQGIERTGHGKLVLALISKQGAARRVEVCGVRIAAAQGFEGGEVLAFFLRPLPSIASAPSGIALSDSFRVALLLETLLRRYIRENYRQGMHPAQWSALRYFKLAAPEERTLTSFARAHHTTMGTASTTVSTLVGKGYLKKHGFRGPIEITGDGETVLQQDPLGAIADILAGMAPEEREWSRQTLTLLAEGLDGDAD